MKEVFAAYPKVDTIYVVEGMPFFDKVHAQNHAGGDLDKVKVVTRADTPPAPEGEEVGGDADTLPTPEGEEVGGDADTPPAPKGEEVGGDKKAAANKGKK